VEGAAGQVVQLEHLAADDDGVAGVRPAGVAHDDVCLAGQGVHDLALALVTPLRADDSDAWHVASSRRAPRGRLGRRASERPIPAGDVRVTLAA